MAALPCPAPLHWPLGGPASRDSAPVPRSPAGAQRAARAASLLSAEQSRQPGVGPGEIRGAGAERASYGECRAWPATTVPGGGAGVGLGAGPTRGGWAPAAAPRRRGVWGRGQGSARREAPHSILSGAAALSLVLGGWTRSGLEGSGWPIRFGDTWCGSSRERRPEVPGLGWDWRPSTGSVRGSGAVRSCWIP